MDRIRRYLCCRQSARAGPSNIHSQRPTNPGQPANPYLVQATTQVVQDSSTAEHEQAALNIQHVFRGHGGRKSVEAKQWLQSQIVNLTEDKLKTKLSDLLIKEIRIDICL